MAKQSKTFNTELAPVEIKMVPVEDLIPYVNNARSHSDAQVTQIAASIREFGWTNPILTDGANGIIAGHGRLMAAKKLKLEKVPVIELSHLTDVQKRAYVLADNKLALISGWDENLLGFELNALKLEEFDMDLLGFTSEEIVQFTGAEDPEEDDGSEAEDDGIEYKENFAVLVECVDESHQAEVYERLSAEGFRCKVLVN